MHHNFDKGGFRLSQNNSLEEHIAAHYAELSEQLRKAADFILQNPVDVASQDLRSLASIAGVSPSTFSRLATALEFESFRNIKELTRSTVKQEIPSFAEKAKQLRETTPQNTSILDFQSNACIENIRSLSRKTDADKLNTAANCLANANTVILFGALGSTGIVEYLAYLARFFAPNWSLAGRMGSSVGADASGLGVGDAVLVVTKTPYAARAVALCKIAHSAGADVIVITDMHHCPALPYATHKFIVPTESPQFFSSYAATLVLLEALIATIVATANLDVASSIRRVEAQNETLREYWAD